MIDLKQSSHQSVYTTLIATERMKLPYYDLFQSKRKIHYPPFHGTISRMVLIVNVSTFILVISLKTKLALSGTISDIRKSC